MNTHYNNSHVSSTVAQYRHPKNIFEPKGVPTPFKGRTYALRGRTYALEGVPTPFKGRTYALQRVYLRLSKGVPTPFEGVSTPFEGSNFTLLSKGIPTPFKGCHSKGVLTLFKGCNYALPSKGKPRARASQTASRHPRGPVLYAETLVQANPISCAINTLSAPERPPATADTTGASTSLSVPRVNKNFSCNALA